MTTLTKLEDIQKNTTTEQLYIKPAQRVTSLFASNVTFFAGMNRSAENQIKMLERLAAKKAAASNTSTTG